MSDETKTSIPQPILPGDRRLTPEEQVAADREYRQAVDMRRALARAVRRREINWVVIRGGRDL